MNKKAQQFSVGTVFIGLGLFALLLIGGFNFYLGHLVDTGSAIPEYIDQSRLNQSFSRFDSELGQTSNDIDSTKGETTAVSGFTDVFSVGVNSLRTAWDSIGFTADYVEFTRQNTELGTYLPSTWWNIVISIFTIVLVLVGIGAFWRYNLVK